MGTSKRQTNETLCSDMWRACDILRCDNNCCCVAGGSGLGILGQL